MKHDLYEQIKLIEKEDKKMNYMRKVAEIFNLKLGEIFEIKEFEGGSFEFTENGIAVENARTSSRDVLMRLLVGEVHVLKKPWKPKLGEKYYFLSDFDGTIGGVESSLISSRDYVKNVIDLYNLSFGNCFKSEEDISDDEIEKVKYKLNKQLKETK